MPTNRFPDRGLFMVKKSLQKMTKMQLMDEIVHLENEITNSSQKISNLLQTNENLLEKNKISSMVLDYSRDPIFAFSEDGTYLYVNQEFANGVLRNSDQIINKKIWDVFSKQEADIRFSAVKWVFEHGEIKVIEVCVPRPDGDRFYITTIKPVMDDEKNVHTVICISKEITERKHMEEQLLTLSTKDILTDLYNRNFFEIELDRIQISRMFPVSIVIADMDNLKGINDRYGHTRGDEALRVTADCLRQSFRAEDIIARIGGDEFGVLLPFTENAPALESVDRLKVNIEKHRELIVGLSIGIATSGMEGQLQDIYKKADDLMYKEKMHHRVSARF
jgi:diguanylate cyclase (GGDEF)-like protein/PAS domain S-box-containing protein